MEQVAKQVPTKATKNFFLHPTPGRLLVEEDPFKYTGRIVVPQTAQRRPTTGTVIAVNEFDNDDHKAWLGKRVLFARFSGTLLTFKNRPAYRALIFDEIIAEVLDEKIELELDDTSLMAE